MFLSGQKIHFMGAGGIGVSALALMAKRRGADVSACDRSRNEMTDMLEREGVPVAIGHDARHVRGCDLLVYTSAVPPDHPERAAAAVSEKRGRFLARLMEGGESWGVAGTHGKTTASWLLASILMEAGRDPTVFIGGSVPGLGGKNHRLGSGPFVAELDESDGSFLEPALDVAVITNVESDHLSYYGDDGALFSAFGRYADGVADKGVLVAGRDSPVSAKLFETHKGRKLSFGIEDSADLHAREIEFTAEGMTFIPYLRGKGLGEFRLGLPGIHNVQNALAALGAALEGGVDAEAARAALRRARGVGRRMERLGVCSGAALYSDYAHHPTEVAAAIAAFRRLHPGKTLVVFQPHLYTRTRDYTAAFAEALGRADLVLLVDIYPAREAPIPGVTAALLAEGAERRGAKVYGPVPLAEAAAEAARLAEGCEAVIMMGAGDIDDVARKMAGVQ